MNTLKDLQPQKVFQFFEEISNIPRKSGDMERISDYLVDFAKDRNLDFIQEKCKNVIIRKKATKGYENIGTVMLQGHIDMVCEKNNETIHDFDNDPIKLIVKDDYIYADGTTLGADNGIAVAYALAILDDTTLKHPNIEAVFTVDEETTMEGAMELAEQNLNAKYMINLDNGRESVLLQGCAGGATTLLQLPIEYTSLWGKYTNALIRVKGLKGGHSGEDITKNRGNSNQIMGRVLCEINGRLDFEMISVNGGSKNNAIPRECTTSIVIKNTDKDALQDIIKIVEKEIKSELKGIDDNLIIELQYTDEKIEKVMTALSRQKIIDLLMIYSSGVTQMSLDIKSLPETSNNLGVVTTDEENKKVIFNSQIRSSIDSQYLYIAKKHEAMANIFGANYVLDSTYPGWKYNKDSKLSELCTDVFKKMFGNEMIKKAVHAGLECGIINEKMPDLDIVSMGPTMYDIHTPDEHLSISSTKRTYEYLVKILENIKDIEN